MDKFSSQSMIIIMQESGFSCNDTNPTIALVLQIQVYHLGIPMYSIKGHYKLAAYAESRQCELAPSSQPRTEKDIVGLHEIFHGRDNYIFSKNNCKTWELDTCKIID